MSVSDLAKVQLPPDVASWIDTVMLVFLGLFILWLVLKAIGFAMRRSYNLTPVATAGSKDIRPDFLEVDRGRQKEMLERGRVFDRQANPGVTMAVRVTKMGMLASGFITLVSAAFLAFGRIEELDATWHKLSAKDRLIAIIETHPVGFVIALAMIAAAAYRFLKTVRPAN